jgi:hypothetical protein
MIPPWKKYPDIPRFSIGWRMGDGEDYYAQFFRWYKDLSDQQAEIYSRENPEFEEWEGFYAMIRHGERPSQQVLKIASRKIEERVRKLHEKNQ